MTQRFTMHSARSYSAMVLSVVSPLVALESSILHVFLKRYPVVEIVALLSGVSLIVWIIADYYAMKTAAITLTEAGVSGQIGRRLAFDVPHDAVRRIEAPRPMTASGPPKGYLNITKPAPANAVIVFAAPVPMRVLGMSRAVTQLAVRVDDPVAFLQTAARR